MTRISLITSRKPGAFSQRDMVGCEGRQMTAGQLQRRVAAQMIEVVGIFIAASDGEHASAQDVRKPVHNPRRVAPIDDLCGKPRGNPHAPLRQGQQHHAAIGTDAATIEGGGDLLVLNRWQRERQQAMVGHGGCGSVRLGKRLASTPNLSASSAAYATSASESLLCDE